MISRRKPIQRTAIKRSGKPIARRNAARKTYLKRSTKPIRQVNPKAQAKRKIGYRKMLASKEYKVARAEAMERAGNRCEEITTWYSEAGVPALDTRCLACPELGEELHAHHLRYPKSRPLAASDLQILCQFHHAQAEAAKMHKTRMF